MSYEIKNEDLDIRIEEKTNDLDIQKGEVVTTTAQKGVYELTHEADGDTDAIVNTGFNNNALDTHLDKLTHLYQFSVDNSDTIGSDDLSGSYTELVAGRYGPANSSSSLSNANPLIDTTKSFILSLWALFSDRVAENIFSQATGIALSRNADETLTLVMGPDTLTSLHKAAIDRWANIVVIREGINVSMYLDGTAVGNFALSDPGSLTSTGPTAIADYAGAVDELAIFEDITEPAVGVIDALRVSKYNDVPTTDIVIDGVTIAVPDGLTARAIASVIADGVYPNYDVSTGYEKSIFKAKIAGVGLAPVISPAANIITIIEGFDSKALREISIVQTALFDDVPQRLKIRLQYFFSEWKFNLNLGIPYIQKIFSDTFSKSEIDAIFKEVIVKTRGVIELIEFISVFNHAQRNYILDFTVRDSNGRIIKLSHG